MQDIDDVRARHPGRRGYICNVHAHPKYANRKSRPRSSLRLPTKRRVLRRVILLIRILDNHIIPGHAVNTRPHRHPLPHIPFMEQTGFPDGGIFWRISRVPSVEKLSTTIISHVQPGPNSTACVGRLHPQWWPIRDNNK